MSLQAFKDALKKKLADAGYTEAEIQLGTIAAEARTVMGMLGSLAQALETDALDLPASAIAGTQAKLLAFGVRAANLEPHRVMGAADLIFKDCMDKAKETAALVTGVPEGARRLQAALNHRPARPEDVN